MTDPFTGVLPFVETAKARSFRRAAERLGVTPGAISRAVQKLERELGVRLFARTSRHVELTPEGDRFLRRAEAALSALEDARTDLAPVSRAVSGPLTVSLPPILGRVLLPAFARFTREHPGVTLHLRFSDRMSRLVGEGVDVAVRVGALPDSAAVARKVLASRWVTLGAPSYLERRGEPRTPGELHAHELLAFLGPRGVPAPWWFRGLPPRKPEARVDLDQGDLLLDAAAAGMGLCQVLDFMVEPYLRDGRLREVLADFAAEGPPVHALCAAGRQGTPRIKALLVALARRAP